MKSMRDAFTQAGFKLKEKKERVIEPKKCRKCGGEMVYKENSNVMVCTGTFNGKPCTNYIILKR